MAEAEIKPAYLISGSDEAKIARTRARLRTRAEREGGAGALELFEAGEGRRAPDAEALLASLAAISLIAARRYLLVDGVEAWGKKDTERVAEALGALPPETTVAMVARGKPPAPLAKAVKAAGGEQLRFEAPKERELPKQLVADAGELGFELDLDAARLLVERLGPRPLRLRNELERLALWAGDGGRVGREQLEAIISDTSEEAIWSLADALVEGDEAEVTAISERLVGQGEALPQGDLLARPPAAPGAARLARARGWPAAEGGCRRSLDAPLRGSDPGLQGQGTLAGGPRRRDPGARRPRALVAGGLGLRRAGGSHDCPPPRA